MWRLNETAYEECQTYNRQGEIWTELYDTKAQAPYITVNFQRILNPSKKAISYSEPVCIYLGTQHMQGKG